MKPDEVLKKLEESGDLHQPVGEVLVMPGQSKHRFERLEDVPKSYLEWVVEECPSWADDKLLQACQDQLDLRNGLGVAVRKPK